MGFIGTTIIFFTIITLEERLPINLNGIITLLFGRRLLEYGNIFLYAHTLFKKRYRLCVKGILDKLWTHVEKMSFYKYIPHFPQSWWLTHDDCVWGGCRLVDQDRWVVGSDLNLVLVPQLYLSPSQHRTELQHHQCVLYYTTIQLENIVNLQV